MTSQPGSSATPDPAPATSASASPPKAPEPELPKPSLARLFKNAGRYGVGQFITSVIGFITGPVLSHYLSRADFGLVGLTRSISGLLSSSYRLGLDGAANRFHYDLEGDKPALQRTIGTLNAFVLGWLALLTLAQEIFGPAIYARLFENVPYAPYGRFVALNLLCGGLMAIPQALWAAQENARRIVSIRVLSSLLTAAATFGLLWLGDMGVLSLYWAELVGWVLLLWMHLRYAYTTFGLAWDREVLKRALAFGLPMVVHLTSHWALDAADRLMLDKYLGRDAVGLYTVAYSSVTIVLQVNASINGAYVPQFTRAHGKPEQRDFVARAVTYFLASTAFTAFAFVAIAPTMIRVLYDQRFAEAAPLACVLCVAPFFHSVYLIYVNGIFHSKKTALIPVFTVLAGLINVGLNALWIPRWGIAGAAWSTLLGYMALAVLFRHACRRVTRIPFESERLARVLGPFGLLTAVAWLLDGKLPLALEIPLKIALVASALPVLMATGFIGPDEKAWLHSKTLGKLPWKTTKS